MSIEFAEITISKQEELLSELKDIKKLLRQVIRVQTPTASHHKEYNYPTLPLQSLEEINLTESCIQDRGQYNFLVFTFNKIYGNYLPPNF